MSIKSITGTPPKFQGSVPYINIRIKETFAGHHSLSLPPVGKTLRVYLRFISRYHRQLAAALVAMPVVVLIQNGFLPLLYSRIIDSLGQTHGRIAYEGWWMMAFLGLHLVVFAGQRAASWTASYLEHATIQDIERHVFAVLLARSDQFHADQYGGALVAQAKRFTGAFSGLLNAAYTNVYSLLIRIGVAFGFLLFLAPMLSFLLLGWTLAYVAMIVGLTRMKMHASAAASAADSTMTAHLGDVLGNISVIKLFGSEEREIRSYRSLSRDKFQRRRHDWCLSEIILGSQALLMIVLEITVLYLSIHLVEQGIFTIGRLALVQFFLGPIMAGLWQIGNVFRQIESALSDAAEMTAMLSRDGNAYDVVQAAVPAIPHDGITFTDVSFGYSAGKPLLRHCNLRILPGETIGLVGPSGSGKSTLTKLLLRTMDIQEGQITIGGQDIADLKASELKRLTAFVPQEPQLFHRSIRENIRYGRPEASDNDIVAAAEQAQAHGFITRLPEGYDTVVGERGSKLSGGERQRIAIARAILKDAPIVVLDEATSALDTESERLVQQALLRLISGKTAIIIAHRLSTVCELDRIVVLQDGTITESGTHDALLANNGLYARLWRQQAGLVPHPTGVPPAGESTAPALALYTT